MLLSINERFYNPSASISQYAVNTVEEVKSIINKFDKHKYKFIISATTTNDLIKVIYLSYELDALNISYKMNGQLTIV